MALLFLEGFEEYDSSSSNNFATDYARNQPVNGIRGSYFYVNNMIPSSGQSRTTQNGVTGKSLYLNDSVFGWTTPNLSTLYFGFGFYTTSTGSTKTVMGFTKDMSGMNYLSNPSTGMRLVMNSGGTLSIVNNNTGTTIATSSSTISASTWCYIEIKYVFGSGTSGACQVKVNETDYIDATSIDTAGTGTSINGVYYQSNGMSFYYDDVYFCDATGSSNNTFLGAIGVYSMIPTANASVAMTPSSGQNYACVDEIPANTTDYVTSSAVNQTDLYNFSGFPGGFTASTVPGVLVKARSTKATANTGQVQLVTNYNSSTATSISNYVSYGGWVTNLAVFNTQPDTTAWSQAAIAGLAAGVKIV